MSDIPESQAGPNQEQIDYWNANAGEKWVRLQDLLDEQLRQFGEAAMDAGGVSAGESVIDVGCGCGDTTLELARRVGPEGRALGVDISAPMLARAAETARAGGVTNASFEEADAQTHAFAEGGADLIFSRFGMMFFADPPAAFANLRSALSPDGRFSLVCWRSIQQNPWMLIPTMAAMQHIEIEIPKDPYAPGPFSLADEGHLTEVLEKGGLNDIDLAPYDTAMTLAAGASVDEAARFMMEMGPMARVLPSVDEDTKARVVEAVRDSLAPHESDAGIVMDAAAWIVSARR